MSFNYQPICNILNPEFEITPGNFLYIGLLKDSYPNAVEGDFDVAGITLDNFYDFEKDYPLSLVQNSWTLSENWPGSNLIYEGLNGLLYSPDFNSTNITAGTVFQVNVTIQDTAGMTSVLSMTFRVIDTNLTENTNITANATVPTN